MAWEASFSLSPSSVTQISCRVQPEKEQHSLVQITGNSVKLKLQWWHQSKQLECFNTVYMMHLFMKYIKSKTWPTGKSCSNAYEQHTQGNPLHVHCDFKHSIKHLNAWNLMSYGPTGATSAWMVASTACSICFTSKSLWFRLSCAQWVKENKHVRSTTLKQGWN